LKWGFFAFCYINILISAKLQSITFIARIKMPSITGKQIGPIGYGLMGKSTFIYST